ncbi:undecaprenyl/decaprenyl-phosphate alpha-N-acetylglucosaminyl 1-phosphate transferase [Bacillaceae bacterium SIJ1]|uniref:MraY family glycosyltransferase n=1 Tax=Litoribacterium kuwaitense TaxID=1398745 RepID=UPI0013E9FC5E|nr:MraY family glycosyltransferase [Litoribacterium kuwaitense]NGP45472.1 undecaprenyl/decaprenyl-phosphate alpha-N-acetylglucosaminyl 1-phosphate transferase [Litoribacterium kuwaitense]
MEQLLLVVMISGLLSYWIIPYFGKIAVKKGFVDQPNARKIHKKPIPLLGGMAMILVFWLMLTAFWLLNWVEGPLYAGMSIALGFIAIAGFLDDYAKTRKKDFPALPKLLLQFGAAIAVVQSGVVVLGIGIPFDQSYFVFPPLIGTVLTVLWIVGLMNAINWIDGMDGLAGGISAISAGTLMCIALVTGEIVSAVIAAAVVGTTLGYLKHNFHPAKILMGDTGSMFLGLLLGVISVLGTLKTMTFVSVAIPVLALGLPIFDSFYVVIRRLLSGKSIHIADKTHAHHRLLAIGLTQRQAVTFLYLVGLCLGLSSVILTLVTI